MPTYEYACRNCGHELEAFQRMSDDPLSICPECEQPALKRKIGLGAGIIFKGGGFYETDFKDRKGTKPESSETGGEKKQDSGGSGESATTSTKKDSPTKAAS